MGKLIFLLVLIAVGVIFGPMFSIWAVNTLFHTNIEITFATWFAAFWLNLLVYGSTVKR